eukprot:1140523_1
MGSSIFSDLRGLQTAGIHIRFRSNTCTIDITVQGNDNQNIFTPTALTQAWDARRTISNITIQYDDNPYTFHDLCARTHITSPQCTADNLNLHPIFFGAS